MVPLLARLLLLPAAIIAGWFVARDAVNFSTIQMTVALILFGLAVVAVAFWTSNRRKKTGAVEPRR